MTETLDLIDRSILTEVVEAWRNGKRYTIMTHSAMQTPPFQWWPLNRLHRLGYVQMCWERRVLLALPTTKGLAWYGEVWAVPTPNGVEAARLKRIRRIVQNMAGDRDLSRAIAIALIEQTLDSYEREARS